MEFLELLLIFLAVAFMILKPEREKLAFTFLCSSWAIMVLDYVGRKSGGLLSVINL